MNCIFCKIINEELPSLTIFEDNIVKVIMDIEPVSNGHVLIVPKQHINNFMDMDDLTSNHIHNISKVIKNYLYDSLNPDGLTILHNYGSTQVVKHYHLHLIPAYDNKPNLIDINEIYAKIKSVI